MKKLAYAFGALVMLIVAAAVALPFVVDLNDYRDVIAAEVRSATGRDLRIEGSIDLSVLPAPTVAVNGVRLANVAGATARDMMSVKAAEARIALLPLLRGEVQVESFTLVEPVVELEVLADGSANWRFATGGGGGEATAAPKAGGAGAVRFDSVVIENGTVVYRDQRRGVVERIAGLDVAAGADSLAGPFHAEGGLVARGTALAFKLVVGAIERRSIPIGLDLEIPSAEASASFTGLLSEASADARLNGKIKAQGASLAAVVAALDPAAAALPLEALGGHPFNLTATVAASAAAAGFNDIAFELNGMQGTGAVSAAFAGAPQVDVALTLNRVDLDRLLATAASTEGQSTPAPADETPPREPSATAPGVYATFDVKVNALVFNEAVARQVQVIAALDEGVLTLRQASALLPGGSDISVFGVVDGLGTRPRFSGQVEASVDNLRAVLDWLEVPAPPVPADRLRKLSFSTKLEVTPELAKFSAVDLRVDLSRLTGGINVAIGRRPAFNAIVVLDRLNLDAYLPPAVAATATSEAAASGTQTADEESPLALLAAFDGEVKARIDNLVYKAVPASGLTIDARVKGGELTLRSLAFDDVAGAHGAVSGKLESAGPRFDLNYGVEGDDLGRLLRAVDAAPAKGLGKFSAHGRVEGDFSAVNVDTAVALGDVKVSVAGAVSALAARPTVDVAAEVRGASLAGFARRFGADLASPKADGPFAIKGRLKGDVGRAAVKLGANAIGVEARIDGVVTGLDAAPGYDLSVTANHPDLAALTAAFVEGFAPAGRDLGELRLNARIVGDATHARLADIDAMVGPTRVGGAVAARWDGPRPSLDADLTAGDIVVDMFMAPATAAGEGAAATAATPALPAAERWSREPIDLSGLSALDAKARIAAASLSIRKLRFDEVMLDLSLADGVLDIGELTGRLYGAPAEVAGRLTHAEVPTAELSLRLTGADMRALLVDAAGVDTVSGRLDLAGRFHSRGRSELELVSALAGEAVVATRGGVIEGIDLARLNARLGSLNSEVDFVRLLDVALTGGKTDIEALDGTFTARDGVLRTTDLRAVLDGGEGDAVATIDLPRWQLALESEFRLTGHPNAPPVGIVLRGPIDNPKREIRDQELRAHVTQKLLGGVIRKVVPAAGGEEGVGGVLGGVLDAIAGGGQAAPAPEPAPQQAPAQAAPAEPKPEEEFKSLLKGLLQGLGQ
ncbi:MAG: AsmA family protein [Alphaproteobacteria bacterium]